jgi:hypothetical protein
MFRRTLTSGIDVNGRNIMNTTSRTKQELGQPNTWSALRGVRLLVGIYLGISVLTLVGVFLLRHNASAVNAAVWIRTVVVAASALLMLSFTVRAANGAGRAYLRLRLVSAIMVVAIVVIIALPGTFPLWLKIEQGICGLILVGVVTIVNGRPVRALFAGR